MSDLETMSISRETFAKALKMTGGKINKITPEMIRTIEAEQKPKVEEQKPGRKVKWWMLVLYPLFFPVLLVYTLMRKI